MFLVAVSDHVNSGDSEEVARAVLQEKYQVCSYHLLQMIHSSFLCVTQKKELLCISLTQTFWWTCCTRDGWKISRCPSPSHHCHTKMDPGESGPLAHYFPAKVVALAKTVPAICAV